MSKREDDGFYTQIPDALLKSALDPASKFGFVTMMMWARENNHATCYRGSQRKLATILGVSKSSMHHIITVWQLAGLVTREEIEGNDTLILHLEEARLWNWNKQQCPNNGRSKSQGVQNLDSSVQILDGGVQNLDKSVQELDSVEHENDTKKKEELKEERSAVITPASSQKGVIPFPTNHIPLGEEARPLTAKEQRALDTQFESKLWAIYERVLDRKINDAARRKPGNADGLRILRDYSLEDIERALTCASEFTRKSMNLTKLAEDIDGLLSRSQQNGQVTRAAEERVKLNRKR